MPVSSDVPPKICKNAETIHSHTHPLYNIPFINSLRLNHNVNQPSDNVTSHVSHGGVNIETKMRYF